MSIFVTVTVKNFGEQKLDNEKDPIETTGHGGHDPTKPDPDEPEQVLVNPNEGVELPPITADDLTRIRVFKVSTGENMIAIMAELQAFAVVVKHPTKAIQVATEDGRQSVILIKWQPYSDAEFHVMQKSQIVTTSSVSKQMVEFYVNTVETVLKNEQEGDQIDWPDWMDSPSKIQIT